jgi:sulfatase maturation enzyme AslB (radical SAM superfamily)
MTKILTIYITNECNFNCSFCIQNDRTKHKISLNKEAILTHLKNNEYEMYAFSGGEPLLNFEFLKEIIEFLPEKKVKLIHSNASLLNKEIVEFINKKNISFSISLNGIEAGEKNLKQLLSCSSFKGDLISLINDINHLLIKKIVLNEESKEDLLLRIYSLHETFPKAKLSLVWDYNNLPNLNVKDFFNMEFILTCLRKFDSNFTEWFNLKVGPCEFSCADCEPFAINPDGTIQGCIFEELKLQKLSKTQEELLQKIKSDFYPFNKVNK